MVLLETTVYSSLERFFLLIFIPFFWKVEIIFIPLSTWRRYTIILKKHHYHCWLIPHLYILNSTTSYLFSHCHIPSSPSWAVISCLIYFLSYGAPSQVWSLCSRQTILSPTPNLLRLLISLRIKFPRPRFEYMCFGNIFYAFSTTPPFITPICLLFILVMWQAFTASIYHHFANVCLAAFLLLVGSHYKDIYAKRPLETILCSLAAPNILHLSYPLSLHFILEIFLFIQFLSSLLECELHEGRDFVWFYFQCPEQCLAYNR